MVSYSVVAIECKDGVQTDQGLENFQKSGMDISCYLSPGEVHGFSEIECLRYIACHNSRQPEPLVASKETLTELAKIHVKAEWEKHKEDFLKCPNKLELTGNKKSKNNKCDLELMYSVIGKTELVKAQLKVTKKKDCKIAKNGHDSLQEICSSATNIIEGEVKDYPNMSDELNTLYSHESTPKLEMNYQRCISFDITHLQKERERAATAALEAAKQEAKLAKANAEKLKKEEKIKIAAEKKAQAEAKRQAAVKTPQEPPSKGGKPEQVTVVQNKPPEKPAASAVIVPVQVAPKVESPAVPAPAPLVETTSVPDYPQGVRPIGNGSHLPQPEQLPVQSSYKPIQDNKIAEPIIPGVHPLATDANGIPVPHAAESAAALAKAEKTESSPEAKKLQAQLSEAEAKVKQMAADKALADMKKQKEEVAALQKQVAELKKAPVVAAPIAVPAPAAMKVATPVSATSVGEVKAQVAAVATTVENAQQAPIVRNNSSVSAGSVGSNTAGVKIASSTATEVKSLPSINLLATGTEAVDPEVLKLANNSKEDRFFVRDSNNIVWTIIPSPAVDGKILFYTKIKGIKGEEKKPTAQISAPVPASVKVAAPAPSAVKREIFYQDLNATLKAK
jgi:hypothetical protein